MARLSLAISLLVFLAVVGCAVETDSELRGTCSLSCSEAKAPGAEYEIVPLLPDDATEVSMSCSAPFRAENTRVLPLNKPLQVKYLVYELVSDFGSRPLDPREDPDGATPPDNKNGSGLIERIPRGGIGFEPVLFGAMATENTNPEIFDSKNNTVSSGKFDGVVTPRSEWCSDTCGVMTYEFWPVCIEGAENGVIASLAAGAAFIKKTWKFTISNEEN